MERLEIKAKNAMIIQMEEVTEYTFKHYILLHFHRAPIILDSEDKALLTEKYSPKRYLDLLSTPVTNF